MAKSPEEIAKLKSKSKQAAKDAVNALTTLTVSLQAWGADQAEPLRELTELIKTVVAEVK